MSNHVTRCHVKGGDAKELSSFVYRYELMQNCWMENPLMRPTFEEIANRIKYLLRKDKVRAACLLV